MNYNWEQKVDSQMHKEAGNLQYETPQNTHKFGFQKIKYIRKKNASPSTETSEEEKLSIESSETKLIEIPKQIEFQQPKSIKRAKNKEKWVSCLHQAALCPAHLIPLPSFAVAKPSNGISVNA